MAITSEALRAFLQTNWGWAAGLSASMFALTLLAGSLLHPARKDEIALWLMGAQSEEGWARSFASLFDAVFGARHLSFRCFIRSAVASLIAVVVIWLLMGNLGALGVRVRAELSLGGVLVLALAVNVLADYASLLETRLLLGHMPRSAVGQALVLVLDFALSAAIIWLAIFAYLRSPLNTGEVESFAEVLGLFSIFSVLFYSTFLTSVWTWAYILSTWVMRAFARLRLAELLDVERQPVRILGLVLAAVVFVSALAAAVPLSRDTGGLTAADRALCSLFKGRVCLDVAQLTESEQARLSILGPLIAECDGVYIVDCMSDRFAALGLDTRSSVHLLSLGCDNGLSSSCTSLGLIVTLGIGVRPNPLLGARLFEQACTDGDARGCINLAFFHREGIGMDADPAEAARLYRQGCDGGLPIGCTALGQLYDDGGALGPDEARAEQFYREACDGGDPGGCESLGVLLARDEADEPRLREAAQLFRRTCDGGSAIGCTNLGHFNAEGIGMDPDPAEAARLYRQACEMGLKTGCRRAEAAGQD